MRWLLLMSSALILTLAGPAAAEGSFSELKEEFEAKIARPGNLPERADLVERMAARDDRDGARALMDAVATISRRIEGLFAELRNLEAEHEKLNTNQDVGKDEFKSRNEVREKIAAREEMLLSHREVLDRIRIAATRLTSGNARDLVAQTATSGSDWRQRGIAARAAAAHPGENGRKAAVRALKDKEPRVVVQALEGLKDRQDKETAEDVAACLKSDVWVVITMAAEALAEIGSPKGVRPLIEALAKTDGRIRDDINRALKKLTGQNFDPDYELWKNWYEEHKADYEGEDAKPLRRGRGNAADPDDSSYYGIKTQSKRIVYVLDISGSMNTEIGGGTSGAVTLREGEEERVSGPKIEIAKNELKGAIRKLPEDAYFNLITFNHLVKTWQPKMMKATQKNKNEAYLFIRDLTAEGSTYTYGALKESFKFAGMGASDPNYASGVDTIFLLSDGAPTDQSFPTSRLVDTDEILTAVRQWNALSKIVIHSIAIDIATQGSSFIQFMKKLAEQNGGKYIERG